MVMDLIGMATLLAWSASVLHYELPNIAPDAEFKAISYQYIALIDGFGPLSSRSYASSSYTRKLAATFLGVSYLVWQHNKDDARVKGL